MIKQLNSYIPDTVKATLLLRSFGLAKIPLLFATSPKVIEMSDNSCTIQMPFRKVIKNHLGGVYFGALAIGADCCVGMLAFDKIRKSKKNVNLVFKSFNANFLKRAEGTISFQCIEGDSIQKILDETLETGERVNGAIKATASVGNEIVAEFELVLSLKYKN